MAARHAVISQASYPGWIQDQVPPDRIDWSSTTHVLHFGRYPQPNGAIAVADMQSESNHAPLVAAAHAAGRKAVLVIGGEGTGEWFTAASSTAAVRAMLVANIVALARRYGYDGVDVDWEEAVPAHADTWVALLAELRRALGPAAWLSADVVSGLIPGPVAVRAVPHVNCLNVMSYWSDGRDELAHYLMAGIPAAKLTIGLGIDSDPSYVDHTVAAVAGKVALVRELGCAGTEYWHVGELRPDPRTDPRLVPLREMVAMADPVQIVARSTWGARYPDGCTAAPVPASEVWLHHTATVPPAPDATVEQESAKIRELEDIGQTRFGCGISYTWLIPPSGRVYQGHTPGRQGTHTANRNDISRAVSLVGTHTTVPPTSAQIRSAAALLRHATGQGWITQPRLTGGHRDVVTTECPGDAAYAWIPAINSMAGGAGVAYALDYSSGHPGAAAVLAAGYVGVIRYVGFDPSVRPKCITKAEYDDLAGRGVGVALVYEDTAGDMLRGGQAGAEAAGRALAWARQVGFPDNRPIYFACDTDIVFGAARWAEMAAAQESGQPYRAPRPLTVSQMDTVMDFLRGAAGVIGPARVGVYGEYDVLEYAAAHGTAAWFWQTRAWSRGLTNDRAHIRQEIGTFTVGGVACDRNTILAADWGQTGASGQEDGMSTADADRVIAVVDDIPGRTALALRQLFAPGGELYGRSKQAAMEAVAGSEGRIQASVAAVLSVAKAIPTDHLTDADRQALAGDILAALNEHGVQVDEQHLLDALAGRLTRP